MEFYFNYVLGLKEKEDLLDEPENRQVGTFMHRLLEDTFHPWIGKKPVIDDSFRQHFMERFKRQFQKSFTQTMGSEAQLLYTVMEARLKHFIDNESEFCKDSVKEIMFIERRFEDVIPLTSGATKFVYQVDRVDRLLDDSILLIDYKTGSIDPMPKSHKGIQASTWSRQSIRETIRSFQMPLYFYYLDKQYPDQSINAAFYNLRTMELKKFIKEKVYDRKNLIETFQGALDFIVAEILNPQVPFEEDLSLER